MNKLFHRLFDNSFTQNLEGMTGYVAWSIVVYLSFVDPPIGTENSAFETVVIAICLMVFITSFYFTTRVKAFPHADTERRRLSFIGQLIAVVVLRTIINVNVVAILAVALAAQLPIRFSRFVSILGLFGLILIDYFFNRYYWGIEDPQVWTVLGIAFNLFAFRMSQRVIQEKDARNEIALLNRELIATQALLQESTKQSERLRISRDLHDGLGHNLTALILKLQYLTYTTEGENKSHVQEAHQVAKQLLTDVRETVHEMREGSNVGLKDALEALVAQIPRLSIQLSITPDLLINDARLAEVLFRCAQEAITNTLKHSSATKMNITLTANQNTIDLVLKDNGEESKTIVEGNGLIGMRERVEKLHGQLDIDTVDGFGLHIQLPNLEIL